MVRPERRTKADFTAVALILVALVLASSVIWLRSDARATVSEPAPDKPDPPTATAVPESLTEVWRAPSPATPVPAVSGPTIATGASGEVLGRDPSDGKVRWRYARDLPLCTVSTAWDGVLAMHRKSTNCSEVTALEDATGKRGPQRNSDAEFGTRLLNDGTYVTTTGGMVETWRSDLVRTQQYGMPTALRNEDNNLERPECVRRSVGVGDSRVAVIEECPQEPTDRLTVLDARPEDDEEPEEVFSTGLNSAQTSVVAVNGSSTAVLSRDRAELVVLDSRGNTQGTFDLPGATPEASVVPSAPQELHTVQLDPMRTTDLRRAARELANALGESDPTITEQSIVDRAAGGPFQVGALPAEQFEQVDQKLDGLPGVSFDAIRYWHTGTATVALDGTHLTPLWTASDTLGPGAVFGGKLLIPVHDGLAVHDPNTGVRQRVIPVDRQGYSGPIALDSAGDTLFEQRGGTLVALR